MIKLNTFQDITFSQAKVLLQQGILLEFIKEVENQPEWLIAMGAITSFEELEAIIQGGCSSGAYMPAVEYATAIKIMEEYSFDITEFLVDFEIPQIELPSSWGGIAAHLCSSAVELWVDQFGCVLDFLEESGVLYAVTSKH